MTSRWRSSTLGPLTVLSHRILTRTTMHPYIAILAAALTLGIAAKPIESPISQVTFKSSPRPLVIWQVPESFPLVHRSPHRHGLGDTAMSEGITSFIEDIKLAHPGIFVYSVKIPLKGSLNDERNAGFVRLDSLAGGWYTDDCKVGERR
jgi:hypothetical protein